MKVSCEICDKKLVVSNPISDEDGLNHELFVCPECEEGLMNAVEILREHACGIMDRLKRKEGHPDNYHAMVEQMIKDLDAIESCHRYTRAE